MGRLTPNNRKEESQLTTQATTIADPEVASGNANQVESGERRVESPEEYSTRNTGSVAEVPISHVVRNPLNPRKEFDQVKLRELADSIASVGLLQPITVTPDDTWFIVEGKLSGTPTWFGYSRLYEIADAPIGERYPADAPSFIYQTPEQARELLPRYRILCGERRFRAAQMAGLTTIPVIIRQVDAKTERLVLVIENLQRQDLNAIEEAEGYRLLQETGMRQTEMAKELGCDQSTISNRIRLLELPDEDRERVRTGELSPSAGRALLAWADHPRIYEVKREAALRGRPVKELEKLDDWWDLQHSGAIKSLVTSDIGVEAAKACLNCKSRRKAEYRDGWMCLDPDCADKLRQARLDELKAQANITGNIPKISDLRLGTYQELSGSGPAGCVEDCEHRSVALNWQNKPVPICTKPGCYNKLANATNREKAKAKKAEAESFFAPAWDLLDSRSEYAMKRATVLVCYRSILAAYVDVVRKAVERTGITIDIDFIRDNDRKATHEAFRALDKLSAAQLVALAAEIEMQAEARDMIQSEYAKPHKTRWFLTMTPLVQTFLCPTCQKTFPDTHYGKRVNDGLTYCSDKCLKEAESGEQEECCANCGTSNLFYRQEWDGKVFCTHACMNAFRKTAGAPTEADEAVLPEADCVVADRLCHCRFDPDTADCGGCVSSLKAGGTIPLSRAMDIARANLGRLVGDYCANLVCRAHVAVANGDVLCLRPPDADCLCEGESRESAADEATEQDGGA